MATVGGSGTTRTPLSDSGLAVEETSCGTTQGNVLDKVKVKGICRSSWLLSCFFFFWGGGGAGGEAIRIDVFEDKYNKFNSI